MRSTILATTLTTALTACLTTTLVLTPAAARAAPNASDASTLSLLPIAVSVAVPVTLLALGGSLVVTAVQTASDGTVWVLERASDGSRASIVFGAGVALAVGTVLTVSAINAGWVLSDAGRAVAFVPNDSGKSLLYNERVTR